MKCYDDDLHFGVCFVFIILYKLLWLLSPWRNDNLILRAYVMKLRLNGVCKLFLNRADNRNVISWLAKVSYILWH
jgi:hypothetical protein